MSTPPTVGSVAAELYRQLQVPYAGPDEPQTWILLGFVAAFASMFQEVDDLARDTPDGPGWSVILDIDDTAAKGLAFLAQFRGADLPAGLSEGSQRQWIRDAAGEQRCSMPAIETAAKVELTGTQRAVVTERDGGSMWRLKVTTYNAETPNPPAVVARLGEQTPGGFLITHVVAPGWSYDQARVAYSTYDLARSAFINYDVARNHIP
jgi:hypothetical protein